jgi:hypothetical protein
VKSSAGEESSFLHRGPTVMVTAMVTCQLQRLSGLLSVIRSIIWSKNDTRKEWVGEGGMLSGSVQ